MGRLRNRNASLITTTSRTGATTTTDWVRGLPARATTFVLHHRAQCRQYIGSNMKFKSIGQALRSGTEAVGMTRTVCGVLGRIMALIGAAAAQGINLPAGPNRDTVSRECQACHDLGMVVAA